MHEAFLFAFGVVSVAAAALLMSPTRRTLGVLGLCMAGYLLAMAALQLWPDQAIALLLGVPVLVALVGLCRWLLLPFLLAVLVLRLD